MLRIKSLFAGLATTLATTFGAQAQAQNNNGPDNFSLPL